MAPVIPCEVRPSRTGRTADPEHPCRCRRLNATTTVSCVGFVDDDATPVV